MAKPALAVVASDPFTRYGALSYFGASNLVRLLPDDARDDADVIVVFTQDVTEETISFMRRMDGRATNPDMGIVLVGNPIGEAKLMRAVRYGLIGFVPRSHANLDQVLRAVLGIQEGRSQLPAALVRSLLDQVRSLQKDVLEPNGLDAAGFKDREIQVLKLLAEGLDTGEVARRLNYSPRTIKAILASLTVRLGLRNRTHAIVHALRAGVI
ncbi:response regulator transcription factor [Streptomyces sp. TS71-3]|uniref:response regulator transcription factor n=1 Tax=Streptomyces sp. TS71-3 TaxID=2733862 RepID=UPI001AFEE6DD|nr:response regulator transcription factor [Streptomyces sp. TS71-3]GHJ37160.1 helix-turn-helix transcriptional regulator [Streptomyces sp. TS71-3]